MPNPIDLTPSQAVESRAAGYGRPETRALFLDRFEADQGVVPSLDGLRAISILLVLVTHLVFPWGPGGYGVFLFFIISGFLICRLLFAEQKAAPINVRAFYIRRVFRLYPVLIVFCIAATAVNLIRDGYADPLEAASALLYFSNYLVVHREFAEMSFQMEAYRVFWSLSVEEHFYLVFPALFIALRTPRRIAALAFAVIVACALARSIGTAMHPEWANTHYFGMLTQFRIDSIAFGILLAALCEIPEAHRLLRRCSDLRVAAFAIVVIFVSLVSLRDPVLHAALRWPLLGLPLIALMAALLFSPRFRLVGVVLNSAPMTWIGKRSYSLYIWHMLAIIIAHQVFTGNLAIIVAAASSFLVAMASYRYVEMPMIRLGKRLQRRTSRRNAVEMC